MVQDECTPDIRLVHHSDELSQATVIDLVIKQLQMDLISTI